MISFSIWTLLCIYIAVVCFCATSSFVHVTGYLALSIGMHSIPVLFACCAIRVAKWPVFHRPGRYFTANLAEAGKRPVF